MWGWRVYPGSWLRAPLSQEGGCRKSRFGGMVGAQCAECRIPVEGPCMEMWGGGNWTPSLELRGGRGWRQDCGCPGDIEGVRAPRVDHAGAEHGRCWRGRQEGCQECRVPGERGQTLPSGGDEEHGSEADGIELGMGVRERCRQRV